MGTEGRGAWTDPDAGVGLGLRVKSGSAVGVILNGSRAEPRFAGRADLVLCDPADPATRQPFHASTGVHEVDPARLAPRLAAVQRATRAAVDDLLASLDARGQRLAGAALVVGSLRPPQSIANDHMRAHALEGALFRTAVRAALAAHAVPAEELLERHVHAECAAVVGRAASDVDVVLAALGRAAGRPWRVEQKVAALAAWMQLR